MDGYKDVKAPSANLIPTGGETSSAETGKYDLSVQRIRTARAALRTALLPSARMAALADLDIATQELMGCILERQGRLRSPLEPNIDGRRRKKSASQAG